MEHRTRERRSKGHSSGTSNTSGRSSQGQINVWLNTFLMAVVAFLGVVLLHQLILGLFSYALSYDTQVSFVEVVSKPFQNKYWSSHRVILMYAIPSVIFILGAAILVFFLIYRPRQLTSPNRLDLDWMVFKVTKWYRLGFWWLVLSVLYISTQITVSPLAATLSKGIFYKGIAVVAYWWGLKGQPLFAFSLISIIINIVFGFVSAPVFFFLAPSASLIKERVGRHKFILRYFLLPLLLLFPVAVFLSYPDGIVFFAIMLLHGLLWLPGFYIRGYQFDKFTAQESAANFGYVMPAFLIIVIVLIRIFLK